MKTKVLLIILIAVAITACNKDNVTTKPQVKIKSISPAVVTTGNLIKVKSTFTDKEGDIGDSIIIVLKRDDKINPPTVDTIKYTFSDFGLPANLKKGELDITFLYNSSSSNYANLPGVINDTETSFGIIIKDRAGNKSDYVESAKILLKK